MSSSSQKPTVLVIGATGRTGRSVVNGLLDAGQYVSTWHTCIPRSYTQAHAHPQNVAILTRPSSASKPVVTALRSRGVEVRIGDCTADPPTKLAEHLRRRASTSS